jgi:hypothetical protein
MQIAPRYFLAEESNGTREMIIDEEKVEIAQMEFQ